MGLGRVLHSTLKYAESTSTRFRHEILIIDGKHLSEESLKLFSEFSDYLHIGKSDNFIRGKIDQADILQIEWGNHPLMYQFLIMDTLPACRIILCCHVVGLTRPNIVTESLIEFADIFLAASKATSRHVLFQQKLKSQADSKLRYVTFPVDFGRFGAITPKAHKGFNIGYVGTLEYSKLHRNFLSMSAAVDIPGVHFVVCGEDRSGNLEKEAEKHIFGYCLVNDVSEREWQIEKLGQWTKGKSHDTYGPIGPYIVTPDEIKDINNLNLSLDVNGQRMQTGNTNKMVFNVYYLVSYLSKYMSLQPGDLITTGTPPGVGMGKKPQVFLKNGDTLRLSIDNLGEQNSKVKNIN